MSTASRAFPTKQQPQDEEEAVMTTMKPKLVVRRPYIIYPENFHIRYWDAMMLMLILIYAFTVPYQLGVSGGALLIRSNVWLITVILMNMAFLIDTFLPFFRAYRDIKSGGMVIDPKRIRSNYVRSMFIPNLLSNLPTTLIFWWYVNQRTDNQVGDDQVVVEEDALALLNLLKFSDVLKLLRLGRAQHLLSTSEFVREFREKQHAYTMQFYYFCFLICIAAHWFACIWSFTAYIQVKNLNVQTMLDQPNWIGNWYTNNYVEGGLNPLGYNNDTNRYVLSLFWAIQTITSIGYGNIAPFTPLEWWVGSILQLLAGILWAYIIGGLVGVVTAGEIKNEMFRERIDGANRLISVFMPDETKLKHKFRRDGAQRTSNKNRSKSQSRSAISNDASAPIMRSSSLENLVGDESDLKRRKRLATRIRRYIYTQSEQPRSINRYSSTLEGRFPIMKTLSPGLQRMSSLMLVQRYLEEVSYLSSRFLGFQEQSLLAKDCLFLEFSCEDKFQLEHGVEDYGRGLFVQISGLAWRSSPLSIKLPILSLGVIGEGSVLLEDEHRGVNGTVRFLSFSSWLFIPRAAVMSALQRNPIAWSECAKWKYLGAALIPKAIQRQEEEQQEQQKGSIAPSLG